MSDKERNDAVEKMIGNMTAEMQNGQDGQYAPLGFTPPPSTTESLNWNQPQYSNNYNLYHSTPDMSAGYVPMHQQFSPQFDAYMHQPPHHFTMNEYNKNMPSMNNLKYIYNHPIENSPPEAPDVFQDNFTLLNTNLHQPMNNNNNPSDRIGIGLHDNAPQSSNHTHLIENLFDWVPTTSGTYSPFGNVDPFKPNVGMFDSLQNSLQKDNNRPLLDEQTGLLDQPLEDKPFPFNRTANRKPRMVAEVKPMRPSYSDVLTKPVPPTTTNAKITKNDLKEAKPKKDNKKGNKSEKNIKSNCSLNRSNTNSEIKDAPTSDRGTPKLSADKEKRSDRNSQLNRKWASLDNINEPSISNGKIEEDRKKKSDEAIATKSSAQKQNLRKVNKNAGDLNFEAESSSNRSDTFNISKNGLKKVKGNSRQKNNDSFGGNDRPPGGKRNQRVRKRENNILSGVIGMKLKQYLKSWWKIITVFLFWLIHLISDVCSLSVHISRDMALNFWIWLRTHWILFLDATVAIVQRVRLFSWIYEKFKKAETPVKESNRSFIHSGLQNNINMPTTGEEAMKRLLACKGKDPYSILGVTPTCTDDDIKKYYKRQAFLVHPDKNQQPGAEEAFKILVHAFDMIGVPEKRATYDKGVVESVQVEQAWSELNELLTQLQQKVEAAANTIRCSACGQRHKRIKIDRPSYAARNCSSCKIHHAARVGDIWAEARCFGFLWNYYACMEGGVYDITEWAGCQKDSLKHLRPDSHQVQYRISSGKQSSQPRRHSGHRNDNPPDLENLLNTLYGQGDGTQQPGGTRRRNKKANK